MIIGVKYWALGAAVPGSWTNLNVAVCDADFETADFDSGEALDGTEWNYKRNRYYVRIVIDPSAYNDGTYGPIVTALRKAYYARVYDTRYSWLGSTNTINFLVKASRPNRSAESILTKGTEIILRAEVVHA